MTCSKAEYINVCHKPTISLFGIARLLSIYQTYWCEIVSSCDFYLHFLVFQWVWASFMLCLLASWFFYFTNFFFISFVHFLFGLWLCVFSFSKKSRYILNDNSLLNLCTLNTFSVIFPLSLWDQNFLILASSSLPIFPWIRYSFRVLKFFLRSRSWR